MATTSKRLKYFYEPNDLVNAFLFDKVAKHVNIESKGAFELKLGGDAPFDPFTETTQLVSTAKIEHKVKNPSPVYMKMKKCDII